MRISFEINLKSNHYKHTRSFRLVGFMMHRLEIVLNLGCNEAITINSINQTQLLLDQIDVICAEVAGQVHFTSFTMT